jgi:hypothetical protein
MDKPIYNPHDAAKDAAEASVLTAVSNLSGGMRKVTGGGGAADELIRSPLIGEFPEICLS